MDMISVWKSLGQKGAATADNCRPTTVEVSTVDGVVKRQAIVLFFLERYTQAYIEEVTQFVKSIAEKSSCNLQWK
ncbi:hypothetical protein GCM10020331_088200 [Ectobacillus funiculus]